MVEGANWKGDKSTYTNNGLGLRVNNTQTTHAGKVYTRDYVIDYTSFENDDLMVFAEGNGQPEYEQKHVYAGSEMIEQFTDKGNWERTLYVHEDVMGSTRYYTKASGQSFAELTYDAWGMPQSPNKLLNNDHGNYVFATFTGHIYDTTLDIYFAEARFYDANNRTWLAMDPIKDGGNWYQYCYGDPINYFDPDGEVGIIIAGYAGALMTGAAVGDVVGGAAGATYSFIVEVTDEEEGIDWHKVGADTVHYASVGENIGVSVVINPVGAAWGIGSQFIADTITMSYTDTKPSLDMYGSAALGGSIANALTGNPDIDPQVAAAIGSAISAAIGDTLEARNGVAEHSGQEIAIDTVWAAVYGYSTSFIASGVDPTKNPICSADFLSTALSGYNLGIYNVFKINTGLFDTYKKP